MEINLKYNWIEMPYPIEIEPDPPNVSEIYLKYYISVSKRQINNWGEKK